MDILSIMPAPPAEWPAEANMVEALTLAWPGLKSVVDDTPRVRLLRSVLPGQDGDIDLTYLDGSRPFFTVDLHASRADVRKVLTWLRALLDPPQVLVWQSGNEDGLRTLRSDVDLIQLLDELYP